MKKNLKSAMIIVTLALLLSAVIPMFAFATGESVDDTVYTATTAYPLPQPVDSLTIVDDTTIIKYNGWFHLYDSNWNRLDRTDSDLDTLAEVINCNAELYAETSGVPATYDYVLEDWEFCQSVYIMRDASQICVWDWGTARYKAYSIDRAAMNNICQICAANGQGYLVKDILTDCEEASSYFGENLTEDAVKAIWYEVNKCETTGKTVFPVPYDVRINLTFDMDTYYARREAIIINYEEKKAIVTVVNYDWTNENTQYNLEFDLSDEAISNIQAICESGYVETMSKHPVVLTDDIKANLLKIDGLTVGGITPADYYNVQNTDGCYMQSALTILSTIQASAPDFVNSDIYFAQDWETTRELLMEMIRNYCDHIIHTNSNQGYLCNQVVDYYVFHASQVGGMDTHFMIALWTESLNQDFPAGPTA